MFSPGNLDFPYPLFTTSLHMVVQFTLASLVLLCVPSFRPKHGASSPHDEDADKPQARPEPVDTNKPIMTPWFYLSRIATTASVTGLDIGLGNTSLKFVTLTFFSTQCRSLHVKNGPNNHPSYVQIICTGICAHICHHF
jgi:solute carrier family 35 protein C2